MIVSFLTVTVNTQRPDLVYVAVYYVMKTELLSLTVGRNSECAAKIEFQSIKYFKNV